MKKKLIIKESDLEQFVKNFLTEEQLELDFPKDSLTELMENKYQELIEEIKEAFDKDDIDTLNEIYDEKIFDLTKNLSKIQNVETVNKFNNLEDILIGYIELHKEYTSIKDELDKSAEELESLF
jgi:uncharacterized protein YpuA (DUF1002 family)